MKVYYNSKLAKRLLFGNFKTCMFFGTVITKLAQLSARTKRHEGIHIRQFWECCVLGAVLWCLGHGAAHAYHMIRGDARDRWNDEAYHASAFEMEAYAHENEPEYQHKRRWFGFVKYYGKI